MPANEVLSEKRGAGLILTFNRPQRANALTYDLANQLYTHLKNATTDRSIRAILLRGAGEHFMDGLDMDLFAGDFSTALEKVNNIILPYHSAIRELQVMDKPVLAAVQGKVTGSGLSLMMGCDLVLAGRGARFNCKFSDDALSPDGACSYFLPRKVGLGKAVELMMLSSDFDAVEAEKMNLINRIVDDAKLQDEALAWLDRLSEGPTKVYGAVKKLALFAFEQDMIKQLSLEHTYLGQSWRSFDFREAVKARATNRPAKYTGN